MDKGQGDKPGDSDSRTLRRYFGLRVQVVIFLLAIILVTLLIVLAKAWFQFDKTRQLVEQDATVLAERVAASVVRVADGQAGHLQLFGQAHSATNFDRARCEQNASEFLRLQQRYLVIGLADMEGRIICFNGQAIRPDFRVDDRAWFREIRDGSAASFGTLVGRSSNKMVLLGALGIAGGSSSAMVAFSSIDLDWIEAILRQEAKYANNTLVSLIDAQGNVVAHSEQFRDGSETGLVPETLRRAALSGMQTVLAEDVDGADRKFFIVPVHLAGQDRFYAVSAIDHLTPADEARAVLADLGGSYFIFTLLTVIVGFLLTERIINRPLSHMKSNLMRYEGGERSVRIGPPYMSNEIGALGQALDQLADAVEGRDKELERRRQNMEALFKRMEAIIAASPVPIVWLTAEWRVKLWNHAAERVFGYSAEETIGNIPPIVPEDQAEASRELLARVFRGEIIDDIDIKRQHKDGRMLDVRASMAPLRDAAGGIDGCLVIFIDETERRQMEHQFSQAQKMEALGQLTGGLSHDFNNLLGIIIGNMDFLLESLEGQPELKSFAQSALNAALQGAELNKRLLAFARRQPLAPQAIQVSREVANATAMMKRMLGEAHNVEADVEADVWLVRADPTQLNAAILNLGLNARDAMPNGGKLVIEARNRNIDAEMAAAVAPDFPPGDYVCLSVSDTGFGMSETVSKRVFEPFFTTKEVGKGTGLGLSMVHGFVKQSGGHVTVYSELGKGTTFRLYLPRLGRSEEIIEGDRGNTMLSTQKPLNVLLVEDNAGLRLVTKQQLTMIGCNVIEAENAVLALPILQGDTEIDLMLSDIVMPGGMNGRELAAQATQIRPDMKILLMSGYSDPRHHDDPSIEREVSPWVMLTKPFRRQELHEAIVQVMGSGTA